VTGALKLRVAREDDASALRAIYAPHVEDSAVSFETEVPDERTFAQRIAKLLPTHPWIVAAVGDEVAGYAYASPHRERAAYRWSVEVTAYVGARFHRRGVGRRLYDTLCTLLQMQHIANAFGIITLPNAASVALHESCGFAHCATLVRVGYKFGAWHDVGWWQKQLRTDSVAPAELTPFGALSATAVREILAR
jgi:phosphinothricin acetyltransferase